MKNFSQRMVTLRKNTGKTSLEVARDIGISPSALSMYESGKRTPKDETKRKLANYYSVSVEYIFFNKKCHENTPFEQ